MQNAVCPEALANLFEVCYEPNVSWRTVILKRAAMRLCVPGRKGVHLDHRDALKGPLSCVSEGPLPGALISNALRI
jgi:hypothetical protein